MDNGLSNGPGLEEPSLSEITTHALIIPSLEEFLALPLYPRSKEETTHTPTNRNASFSTPISYMSVSMNPATTLSILPLNSSPEHPPTYSRTSLVPLRRLLPLLRPLLRPLLPLLDLRLLEPLELHHLLPLPRPLPQLLLPLLDPLRPEPVLPLLAHRHHPVRVLAVI